MANIVVVSGQFGNEHTSFADSPVVIRVDGLSWPNKRPFTIVRIEVKYNDTVVGDFRADTGGQTEIYFDISSALRAIWAEYDFAQEVAAAAGSSSVTRAYRGYTIALYTEYLSRDGVFTTTQSGSYNGGSCAIGGLTEWERSQIANADVSTIEFTNTRNGDASTKPVSSPERVGINSITSWVDLSVNGTTCHYFGANAHATGNSNNEHAPLVLRDSQVYVDFLFVNRRGAVETCSALMKESLGIDVETTLYSRVEHPSFAPSRSLMSVSKGGRRSWQMSSGHQTREWCAWWTQEFLMSRRWWMRIPVGESTGTAAGAFVPVVVEPTKKQTTIYDRSKQDKKSVEFTVTMALEG